MEHGTDRRISSEAAVMYQAVAVKRELSGRANLSVYRPTYVPTLNYGNELWVVTERMRLRIQAIKLGSPLEIW